MVINDGCGVVEGSITILYMYEQLRPSRQILYINVWYKDCIDVQMISLGITGITTLA